MMNRSTLLAGHRVLLSGSGTPTVVLLNGAGVGFGHWRKTIRPLAELSSVFAYDRLLPPDARTAPERFGRDTMEALRTLLAEAGSAPPWLLVGHSMGGIYAQLLGRHYPQEAAGIVLVDSAHPAQMRQLEADFTGIMRWGNGLTAWLDRRFGPGQFTEVVLFNAIGAEVEAAPPFPPVPLAVLTAGRAPAHWLMQKRILAQHLANQAELAALSPLGRQQTVASGHLMPLDRPQAIVAAVAQMLEGLRRPGGLRPAP